MEPASPNEQSTSSAPDTGPTTTALPVPPSGNKEAHPRSTKRPAPDSPATTSPKRIQLDKSMMWLGDLAVEVVFPAAAVTRLSDDWASNNEKTMRCLLEGEILRGERWQWMLVAGSRAEGVAMEDDWAHTEADEDFMQLYNGGLVVGVDGTGQLPPRGVAVRYRGEGCPPAYTRLEVVNKRRLLAAINRKPDRNVEVPAHTCVEEEDGRQWLLSRRLLDVLRGAGNDSVQGPAVALPGGLVELIPALVSTGPYPDMAAYTERLRTGWPSPQQITDLLTLPILIVCVGPKGHPDTGRLFRASFSPHEMILITDLVLWAKQGYICFKLILKALLATSRRQGNNGDNDGRSRVGSFHMKTVFLRYLEEHPPQPEGSPFQLALELCRNLQQCLVNGNIPHYFIPECNLLEKVGERERQEALSAVGEVLGDPLAAIISSPLYPEEIYGFRHSRDDLLPCFRAVSEHLTRGAQQALQRLLQDLDEHRMRKYGEQLEYDGIEGILKVSRRPGLVRLADYLQQIIPV